MTSILRLKKWGYLNELTVEFQIGNTIREQEYYRCFSVKTRKWDKMLLWRLHCAANPFISLIQLFKLFALPTKKLVSRQLLRFIVKCWKVYKQSKSMNNFLVDFYQGKQRIEDKVKVPEIDEINKIMSMIQRMNKQQMDRFAQQYQSSSIKENEFENKQCAIFAQKVDEILQKLTIMPHQQRMNKLKNLCGDLTDLKAQLLFDNKTAYILTTHDFSGKQSTQISSLQQLLFINTKKNVVQICEQTIHDLSSKLLEQLYYFDTLYQYSGQSYPLDVDSILIETKRGQDNKIVIGKNCQIDLMKPFLKQLGLTNQIRTIQNLIIFHSRPKPQNTSFYFKQVLRQHFKITDDLTISNTEIAIKWILICDFMLVSRLKPQRKSLLQAQQQKIKIINTIIGIQKQQKTISKKYQIHSSTKLLINLIKLQKYEAQTPAEILANINLKNIKNVSQSESDNEFNFDSNRYRIINSSIQLKETLFFQKQSLKDYCQQNKCIKSLDSHGKYIIMYLLCNYAVIQTQRQFLELWGGQQVKLNDENDPLYKALSKFIKILPKIELYIDQIDNSNPRWGDNIKDRMRNILKFCKTLKGRNFGTSCRNLSSQNQKIKEKDTKQLVDQIKENLSDIFEQLKKDLESEVIQQKLDTKIGNNNYFNARKNICLKYIFTSLNLYNYSELYCEKITLTQYKAIHNQTTKRQIKSYFDKAEKRLHSYIDKNLHFFQEMFTTLGKKQKA